MEFSGRPVWSRACKSANAASTCCSKCTATKVRVFSGKLPAIILLEPGEDFLKERYPQTPTQTKPVQSTGPAKKKEEFRNYEANARPSVREFYRLNHRYQTCDFVQGKRKEFLSLTRRQMSVWEALEYLNTLVDESDPDTDLSQLDHLLQTAEQIRHEGHPRWFILSGLIHDLGKILCLYGEPQWAVVGDTFPVGCAWSDRIVFHQ